MSLRGHLITSALLGTAQRPFDIPWSGTPLDALLSQLNGRDAARRLLDSAALILWYEKAGAMPVRAPEAPDPAGDDPRPLCMPAAARHLAVVLADRRGLLAEWLSLIDEANQRPPEESIPALLDIGTNDTSMRPGVARCCGALGTWLAQFRREWAWMLTSGEGTSDWETGSMGERLGILKRLLVTDRARCYALLQSSWSTEPADNKRQFIEALGEGLSPGDEDFLEGVLEDRSVAVRRAAAEHLACLKGSRLVKRMRTRLEGRIRILRTGADRATAGIEVEPLENLDAVMVRDGMEKKAPAGSGLGDRAWWTMQAVAAIPPAFWCEKFQLSASELIGAAGRSPWQRLLTEGWRMASIRHRAADWLEAFTTNEIEPGPATTALFSAMSHEARERAMLRLLNSNPKVWLTGSAACCPHDWSVAFTEGFVEIVDHSGLELYQTAAVLRTVKCNVSPLARWPQDSMSFADFTDTVSFRRGMHEAIKPRSRQ